MISTSPSWAWLSQAPVPALRCNPAQRRVSAAVILRNKPPRSQCLVASLSLARGPGGWLGGPRGLLRGSASGCRSRGGLGSRGIGQPPGHRLAPGLCCVPHSWGPRHKGQWLSGTSSSYGKGAGVRVFKKTRLFKATSHVASTNFHWSMQASWSPEQGDPPTYASETHCKVTG